MAETRPIKRRYNNSRDVQGDLLRALAKVHRKNAAAPTVRDLQDLIGPPIVSETAIRNNLKAMGTDRSASRFYTLPAWVEQLGTSASGGRCWGVTDEGMRVAESRGYVRARRTKEA